jgi:hypothetical protein
LGIESTNFDHTSILQNFFSKSYSVCSGKAFYDRADVCQPTLGVEQVMVPYLGRLLTTLKKLVIDKNGPIFCGSVSVEN